MAETDEIELIFTKEGMKVRRKVEMPFTGEEWHEKLISYREIEGINGIELTVNRIEPEIEGGVLKGLTFHVTHYLTSLEETYKVQPSESYRRGIEIQGDFISCRFSNAILVETANWLIDKGYLKRNDVPIDLGGNKRYLINSFPKHKEGSNFTAPRKLKNGMYIETHCSHKQCVEYSRRLLEYFDFSKGDLKVIGFFKERRRKGIKIGR